MIRCGDELLAITSHELCHCPVGNHLRWVTVRSTRSYCWQDCKILAVTHRQERDTQDGLELPRLARGCTYFYTSLCTSFPEQRLKENKHNLLTIFKHFFCVTRVSFENSLQTKGIFGCFNNTAIFFGVKKSLFYGAGKHGAAIPVKPRHPQASPPSQMTT